MLISDNLIQHYETATKGGAAPHTMHNIPLEFAKMLLTQLGDQHPEGKVDTKQANNIWNYVLSELKKKGYDPYTIKENGFKEVLSMVIKDALKRI